MKFLLVLVATTLVVEALQPHQYVAEIDPIPKNARGVDPKPARLGQHKSDVQLTMTRNALVGKERLWPNGTIPYTFTTKYASNLQAIIMGAMTAIQDNTCIKFVPRTTEVGYITFAANPDGEDCSSKIGKVDPPKEQTVYLSYSSSITCLTHDIVVHELMHAIGVKHEQARADRDKYIRVNTANIDPDMLSQFEKVNTWNYFDYGCPYTYESVMHYDKYSFGISGKITMDTLDPKYADVIGNVKAAHPNDYEIINRMYKCTKAVTYKHTCSATVPKPPCLDDPTEDCSWIVGQCAQNPTWIPYCRKTCNACPT